MGKEKKSLQQRMLIYNGSLIVNYSAVIYLLKVNFEHISHLVLVLLLLTLNM